MGKSGRKRNIDLAGNLDVSCRLDMGLDCQADISAHLEAVENSSDSENPT